MLIHPDIYWFPNSLALTVDTPIDDAERLLDRCPGIGKLYVIHSSHNRVEIVRMRRRDRRVIKKSEKELARSELKR